MVALCFRVKTQHIQISAITNSKFRLDPAPPHCFVAFSLVSYFIMQGGEGFYLFSPRQRGFMPFFVCHSPFFSYLCTVLLLQAQR